MTRKPLPIWRPTVLLLVAAWLSGCGSAFERIDARTNTLMAATNDALGADTITPRPAWPVGGDPGTYRADALHDSHPPTVNPAANELLFTPDGDAESVVRRLETYTETSPDAIEMTLTDAVIYATEHAREYRFAEEDYLLEALRLISERHLWGPRLFNDTSVDVIAVGDNALFDSSVRLVNDLQVTQRLPWGGEVTASLLASVTRDLHEHVAGENVQSLDLLFSLDIPLLRGAGWVARESLLQSERNIVYAARAFERFRRQFLVDITTEFLDLVISQQAFRNTEANVTMLEGFERREAALAEAGRTPPF